MIEYIYITLHLYASFDYLSVQAGYQGLKYIMIGY